MKAVGVIPARWGSSRKLSEICVATDDIRIAELSRKCGARAVMTDSDLPTGTDRIWQAARELDADIFVNVQGDEPLIEGSLLDQLVEPFERDLGIEMATLGRALDEESLLSENTAKIVLNQNDEALYFSRFPIPYSRQKAATGAVDGALKHIGIYAYRRSFLEKFCAQAPTVVERSEGLEQLRALYLGARIKVVRVEHDSWGVDTPDDVQKIEMRLKQRMKQMTEGRP
jgi:3-deoxy-manno-octulosonate cytidylyltransferase (CMP-KDO synthetase)